MAKNDIFTRAKAYRKKHPRTAWTDCVKAVSKAKKQTVGGTRKKKPAVKKVTVIKAKTVKVSGTKKRHSTAHIGAVALNHISRHHNDLKRYEAMAIRYAEQLKDRKLSAKEKAIIRRDVVKVKNAISATKKHIQSLKKSI